MATCVHTIHIYEKPALGSRFMYRYPVYNYTHTISAMGWFDTASCNIRLSDKQAEMAIDQWIGNRVAIFVDNPVEPIWEGLVARVTPEFGNVVPTRSLDNMFNRVKVVYSSSVSNSQTAVNDNTASQAIYGIKEGSVEGISDAAGATRTTTLRDFYLNWQGYPQTSMQFNTGGRIVRLELIGIYHTLEWENVRDTGTTSRQPNTIITDLLGTIGNAATFFNNADTSQVTANAAFTGSENTVRGETAWQMILKFTEPGDGTNRWIAGITPTNPNTGTRVLYYRQANDAIEYICYARDGARIRNQYGGLVNAWNVLPDRSLRVNDILVGWNGIGDDPREIYIESVNYDAESQLVAIQGADDISTDGIIQAKRFAKMLGTRFGAPPRVTIT